MDRILCATDFSDNSDRAVNFASAFAKRCNSSVELVHVFNPSVCVSYEEAELTLPLKEREQTRTATLEAAAEPLSKVGIPCAAILKCGHSTSKEVLAEARRWDADPLVVGTQSKSGVERFLVGSTAEDLIRNSDCPVLTIGPHVNVPPDENLIFKNVVFARDFSPSAAKAEEVASAFAEEDEAHLSICHVRDTELESGLMASVSDAAIKRHLEHGAQDLGEGRVASECEVDHGKAADAILDLAAKVNADLIVLGARRASFWLTHVARGVTLDVIRKATAPVMTISG